VNSGQHWWKGNKSSQLTRFVFALRCARWKAEGMVVGARGRQRAPSSDHSRLRHSHGVVGFGSITQIRQRLLRARTEWLLALGSVDVGEPDLYLLAFDQDGNCVTVGSPF
jgi:hypothetical protein